MLWWTFYRYLKLLLRKEGLSLYTTAEFEVVKTMKERVCYLATNPQREESVDTERLQYQLPDGSTVEVSLHIQFHSITYYYLYAI